MRKHIDKEGFHHWGKDNPYIGREDDFQMSVAYMLDFDRRTRGMWFHPPNGGRRITSTFLDKKTGAVRKVNKEAAKFKKMGTKSGVPDCVIDVPSGQFHGLRIELKVRNRPTKSNPAGSLGRLSDSQKDWIRRLNKSGYYACVCWSINSVRDVLDDYFVEQKYIGA